MHDFVLVLSKQKPKQKRFCFDSSKYHCESKKSFALVLPKTKTQNRAGQQVSTTRLFPVIPYISAAKALFSLLSLCAQYCPCTNCAPESRYKESERRGEVTSGELTSSLNSVVIDFVLRDKRFDSLGREVREEDLVEAWVALVLQATCNVGREDTLSHTSFNQSMSFSAGMYG